MLVGNAGRGVNETMDIRDYLGETAQELHPADVAKVLRHPWCWPRTGELSQKAKTKGYSPGPKDVAPGEVLLVSWNKSFDAASLWRLIDRAVSTGFVCNSECTDDATLTEKAHATAERAVNAAWFDLPVLAKPGHRVRPSSWKAHLVCKENAPGYRKDYTVEGDSFGVAFALAAASRWMNTSVPTDVVASASIKTGTGGELGKVVGLDKKMALVHVAGLGISKFIVSEEDHTEAEAIRVKLGAAFDVVGLSTLSAVFAEVFPPPHVVARQLWSIPAAAAAAAESLYTLTIRNNPALPPVPDWTCVKRTVALLEPHLELPKAMLHMASAIAERHTGGTSGIELPAVPESIATDVPRLLAHAAQGVQAAVDNCSENLRELLDQAEELEKMGQNPVDVLPLQGARARGLSALRDYADAQKLLFGTVESWQNAGHGAQCSFALCELARVTGLLARLDLGGGPDDWQRIIAWGNGFTEMYHHEDPVSIAYVKEAIGRGLVTAGRATDALKWLDWDEEFLARGPREPCEGRLRWLALALQPNGPKAIARAAMLRAELTKQSATSTTYYLAGLDVLVERGASDTALQEVVDDLVASKAQALKWMLEPTDLATKVERLRWEYAY